MADLNKLRQVNPHWKPTKSFIEDQEEAKQKLEKEHLNKVHNKLWGEDYYKDEEMNPSRYTKNDIAQTKDAIKEKILKHFDDALFEMVSEEMGKYYVFQSSNYLTEAGYDVFEDEWFEFYHEHHGDILYQVKQEITD
tara:strand:+ start:469 stop:879 length:411 start_codon:yes stop_codon:yes gene_type:complete